MNLDKKKISKQADIDLEILQANYLEHFKFEKDLSLIFPVNHPKRVKLRKHAEEILQQIHKLKNKI